MRSHFAFALVVVAACSKTSTTTTPDPPPAKPSTGAPIAFEVTAIHPKALDVRAYNFSAQIVAQYSIVIRYLDASGQPIKVSVGTPFEKDFASWSMSGRSYECDPTSWCKFQLDHLDVPAGTVKAIVLAERVTALKPNSIVFEDKPIFDLPYTGKWPG